MQKPIQITQVIEDSAKEIYPFLRFAFFWLFLLLSPFLLSNLLLVAFPSLFLLEHVLVVTDGFGYLVWIISIPYLLQCFYKNKPPSFIQILQQLKAHFFPILIEVLRIAGRLIFIAFLLAIILIIPAFIFASLPVFSDRQFLAIILSPIFFSLVLTVMFAFTFVWPRFLFIPLICLFNKSYQKKQIDVLEYSKVLTEGYRSSIFIWIFTILFIIKFLNLFPYILFILRSPHRLLYLDLELPYEEISSLTLEEWVLSSFSSYFFVPFSIIVYYKFYMLLEGRLQDLDTEELNKKEGISNFFKVLF